MSEILFHYHKINPTTWVYVSSLLLIGLYFKFSRLWSVRNLDLVLLILLAPGLLLVDYGQELRKLPPPDKAAASVPLAVDAQRLESLLASQPTGPMPDDSPILANFLAVEAPSDPAAPPEEMPPEDGTPDPLSAGQTQAAPLTSGELAAPPARHPGARIEALGYIWLFCAGGLLLVRMLLDPTMIRRPLLEPNLSVGGLTFIGCSLLVFLLANVITGTPTEDDLRGPRAAEQLLQRREAAADDNSLTRYGPGLRLLYVIPNIATNSIIANDQPRVPQMERRQIAYSVAAKVMAILAHLAVVIGMVVIGYWHFDNIRMGIGAAALYLLLPYTAQMTGRVEHVLPAALLIWAIVCYRRPLAAGMLLGLAAGVVYYPLFLLPLWISFYWQRGLMRFVSGVLAMLAVVLLSLAFTSRDLAAFWDQTRSMFGLWLPVRQGLEGIWALGWDPVYRIPLLAGAVAISLSMALWPAQKNLGTLLSCSAAVMLATQFWHGHGGGTFMAWYLPPLLMTIFRPNLEDRVALTVLGEGWLPRRAYLKSVVRAA